MAALPSNDELLQRFAASRSAEAFRELVNRYSGFVMAAARRQTGGDWHAAEDVAQRVFTGLAQEAKKVKGESLGAWLYRRTSFVAAGWRRSEGRRRAREEKAVAMAEETGVGEGLPAAFDEAMGSLREGDRQMLLWRYVEERSYSVIGSTLGISEDAAQKRAARALEQLRAKLVRRGMLHSASALAGLLVAAAGRETVSAAAQARWCASAMKHAGTASWAAAGLAIPAACLITGVVLPVTIPSAPQKQITAGSGATTTSAPLSSAAGAAAVVTDLPGLMAIAEKIEASPLWMARLDRAVARLGAKECAQLMEELGYAPDFSVKNPLRDLRKRLVARWSETDPKEAAKHLSDNQEREVAFRSLGLADLPAAEALIAQQPKEGDRFPLWRAALCGLASKDLLLALQQMPEGGARLNVPWMDQMEEAVIMASVETNPEQTAKVLASRNRPVEQGLRAQALENLAKTNAALALALMRAAPLPTGNAPNTENAIFQGMLKQDRREAVRLAPELLGARCVNRALDAANALYAEGFESARTQAERIADPDFRDAVLNRLCSRLAGEKPAEALAMFKSDDVRPGGSEVWWTALSALAVQDAPAAAAVKLSAGAKPSGRISSVASAIARKDFAAALTWLEGLPDACQEERLRAFQTLVSQQTGSEPRVVAEQAITLSDPASQAAVLPSAVQHWCENDPPAAKAWASRLSGTPRMAAAAGILQASKPGTPEGMVAAQSMVKEMAHSQGTPPASIEYAVSNFMHRWLRSDPEKASAWADALPRGAMFDFAAAGIAEGLRVTDPRDALTWAASIGDPGRRNRWGSFILQDWSQADSKDARAAVEALNAPPEVKETFSKLIRTSP